jgi:CheY-like chemotaxis protein
MTRVVIVDDQATNRKVMTMLMTKVDAAADVAAFADPIEALVYARQNTPDLLITDFKMPFINGDELIRRFRTFPKCETVPAVMVTAGQDVDARRLAFEAGSTDFLTLPFENTRFCERSRSLLAHHLSMESGNVTEAGTVPTGAYASAQTNLFNGLIESIGSRLLRKTEEVQRLHAEIGNLINISGASVVIVDNEQRVRWFSANLSKLFEISPKSVGQQLTSVASRLNVTNLEHEIDLAMANGTVIQTFAMDADLAVAYRILILPNIASRNGVGVTITFAKMTSPPAGVLRGVHYH